MKNAVRLTTLLGVAVMIFAASGIDVMGQALQQVSEGTRFRVRMNETLSSKTAKSGDRFTVTVREPVYSTNGAVVIPVGSEVVGRVDTVNRAEKGGNPGAIDVSFVQLVLPNGTARSINGSLTDLVSDDAKSDPEGAASDARHAIRLDSTSSVAYYNLGVALAERDSIQAAVDALGFIQGHLFGELSSYEWMNANAIERVRSSAAMALVMSTQ